ncbi:bromodomain-containing protein DDB_G0278469 [Medicago truncatula]|uniref:bromodomain-containing protein DDB_G0278469 n=1 Tax=Medicago truncatula TaxID=3880 RepID=UPI000D2F4720|nr:bromodomain-containing protein DDB_G0278469 [Medicago truncatula]
MYDVSTHAEEKSTSGLVIGNPDETLIFNSPDAGRKLGLEDLNDAIDSTKNMEIDVGNETNVNDFNDQDPDNTGARKDVGPDVETSLDQPRNSIDVTTIEGGNKDLSVKNALEIVVNSYKSPEDVVSEEEEDESEEVSKETEKEEDSETEDKDKEVVDVEELNLVDIPLAKTHGDGVAKRLRSNKGIVVVPSSTLPKKRTTSLAETPKSKTKATSVGPNKGWSKYEVEEDALNIITSFHLLEFTQRWKFIYHRRVAVQSELSEKTVKIKEVMELIKEAGLVKTVCNLGDCYEKLVKEFVVNIPEDCDNPLSREYQKVYARRECVNFSPNIVNRFLGLAEEDITELEATDNQVSREVTASKVRTWPKKGKISSGKLSVKYAILNRIGAANWVPTTHTSNIATSLAILIYVVATRVKMDFGRYIFDQP